MVAPVQVAEFLDFCRCFCENKQRAEDAAAAAAVAADLELDMGCSSGSEGTANLAWSVPDAAHQALEDAASFADAASDGAASDLDGTSEIAVQESSNGSARAFSFGWGSRREDGSSPGQPGVPDQQAAPRLQRQQQQQPRKRPKRPPQADTRAAPHVRSGPRFGSRRVNDSTTSMSDVEEFFDAEEGSVCAGVGAVRQQLPGGGGGAAVVGTAAAASGILRGGQKPDTVEQLLAAAGRMAAAQERTNDLLQSLLDAWGLPGDRGWGAGRRRGVDGGSGGGGVGGYLLVAGVAAAVASTATVVILRRQ